MGEQQVSGTAPSGGSGFDEVEASNSYHQNRATHANGDVESTRSLKMLSLLERDLTIPETVAFVGLAVGMLAVRGIPRLPSLIGELADRGLNAIQGGVSIPQERKE
jgi:hypothetical protein